LAERLRLSPLRRISTPESHSPQSTLPRLRPSKPRSWRSLVFDIENRPLSYWYDGHPTAEVTAIAWKWLDEESVEVRLLDGVASQAQGILADFRVAYEEADVVIGHNIRRHDLPLLNGAYVEHGLDPLPARRTIDTLRDLARWKDVPRSLEYLADWLDCPYAKPSLSQHVWRQANRLLPEGLAVVAHRCEMDVLATEWCYRELLSRGLIVRAPRIWSP
jgi:hypothetical protein